MSTLNSGDYTVSFWMKSTSTANSIIVEKREIASSGDRVFQFGINNPTSGKAFLAQVANGGANQPRAESTTTVNDGSWHHIVGVYNGSTLNLYIDGSSEDTDTGYSTTSNDGIELGRRRLDSGTGSNYYDGVVDELAFVNRIFKVIHYF